MPVKYFVGDIVQLRKAHPCGSDRWEVMRTGMDFRIRCQGCRHVVMVPRKRFERSVKAVISSPVAEGERGENPSSPE